MTTNGRQESKSTASTDPEEDRSFGLKRREILLAGSAIAAASALGTGFAPRGSRTVRFPANVRHAQERIQRHQVRQ